MLACDYAIRFALSSNRLGFLSKTPFDFIVVVLPLLRPLRLLRLVTLLSMLNRYAGNSLRGKVGIYLLGSVSLIVFVASLAVLDAERGGDGSIQSFGDALWWSITTITTVGYGDMFPVTATGRFIAGGLMFAGIAVLGVVTASFASWLVERVSEIEESAAEATRRDIQALAVEVQKLREQLDLEPRT
jgi:voltage-gated potassium channel